MATKDRTSLKNDFANGKYATGEKFADLIDSMKVVQLPVVDPQALGTSLSFIDSISQDADGKITATKKTVMPTVGSFRFVANDPTAEAALTTYGATYSSAISGVSPSADTTGLILLMNDDDTTPTKTMMIATQSDGNNGYQFVYVGDLDSTIPTDVINAIADVNVGSKATLALAIATVPDALKKAGLKVTYYDTTVSEWVEKQYIGTTTEGWSTESNWVDAANRTASWENKKTVNIDTGKAIKIDNANIYLSGFIPISDSIVKGNAAVLDTYGRIVNNTNIGFAFYEFPTEESFIPAASAGLTTSAQYSVNVIIPNKANYVRLTKHTTYVPNPRIVQNVSVENIYHAEEIRFIEGLAFDSNSIPATASVGDTVTLVPGTSADNRVAVVACSAGDKFTINTECKYFPYCFLSAENVILELGTKNSLYLNQVITAPSNTAWLVLQCTTVRNNYPSFKGEVSNASMLIWSGTQEDFRAALGAYNPHGIYIGEDCGALKTNDCRIVNTWSDRFVKEVNYGNDLEDYANSFSTGYYKEYYVDKGVAVIGSDHPLPNVISFVKRKGNSDDTVFNLKLNGVVIMTLNSSSDTINLTGLFGYVRVFNLEPEVTYTWELTNRTGASVLKQGALTPKGYPRWIKVMNNGVANRVDNVRDLGGWPIGVGKHVKYGVVFRGSDMNWGHTIDSDGISVLKNDLHVGYDMDLRNSAEYSPFLESSPLGSDVVWGNFPVSAYDIENTRSIYYANALTQIATNLEAGIVTYFHCKAGADRTGTLAFLILGLIGVSESDLNKEYELTAIRNRNVIYSGSAGVESDVNLHTLADSIKVYNGDTLKDKIESWALAKGVTSTNIEKIRQYMIVDD